MTTNRLAKSKVRSKGNPQQEADRMNAYTRGHAAGHDGEFIDKPRHDVHWVVRGKRCVIEWATAPIGRSIS